jgi:hypothetical protein
VITAHGVNGDTYHAAIISQVPGNRGFESWAKIAVLSHGTTFIRVAAAEFKRIVFPFSPSTRQASMFFHACAEPAISAHAHVRKFTAAAQR